MLESSPKRNLFLTWISWHYINATKNILSAWRNFLVFNSSFFSIGYLLKTLLSPWKKETMEYGRGFDLKVYATALLSNLISRILGMIVRIIVIGSGLIAEFFIFILGIIIFLFWLFLPLIILAGVYSGLTLLI